MSGYAYEHLPQALELGMITTEQLRLAATRTLRLRFELGLFDPPQTSPFAQITAASLASAAHQRLAKRSAAAALVLLRNQDSTLPLPAPQQLKQLAILGMRTTQQLLFQITMGATVASLHARLSQRAKVCVPPSMLTVVLVYNWHMRRVAAGTTLAKMKMGRSMQRLH
jgi:beta-glucosidase-like glycosyl hydrolase